MTNVTQVERYGVLTFEDAKMDAARKAHCLCLRCSRLKPDARNNCPMAEVIFRTKGMAVGVSRCQEFEARP